MQLYASICQHILAYAIRFVKCVNCNASGWAISHSYSLKIEITMCLGIVISWCSQLAGYFRPRDSWPILGGIPNVFLCLNIRSAIYDPAADQTWLSSIVIINVYNHDIWRISSRWMMLMWAHHIRLPCPMTICDDHIWLSYMLDYRRSSSYMRLIYQHRWSLHVIIIYDGHIWWSDIMITCDHCMWWANVITIHNVHISHDIVIHHCVSWRWYIVMIYHDDISCWCMILCVYIYVYVYKWVVRKVGRLANFVNTHIDNMILYQSFAGTRSLLLNMDLDSGCLERCLQSRRLNDLCKGFSFLNWCESAIGIFFLEFLRATWSWLIQGMFLSKLCGVPKCSRLFSVFLS